MENKLLCLCAEDFAAVGDLVAHRQHCEIWQRFMAKQTLLSQQQDASRQLGTPVQQKVADQPLPVCEICGTRAIGWKAGSLLCDQHWNKEVTNMANENVVYTGKPEENKAEEKSVEPAAAQPVENQAPQPVQEQASEQPAQPEEEKQDEQPSAAAPAA